MFDNSCHQGLDVSNVELHNRRMTRQYETSTTPSLTDVVARYRAHNDALAARLATPLVRVQALLHEALSILAGRS